MRPLLTLTLFLVSLQMHGQNVQDLTKQKSDLLQNIANTNQMIDENKGKQNTELLQINLLNSQIKDRTSLISIYQHEIKILENQVNRLTSQSDSLQRVIDAIKDEYALIIYNLSLNKLYKNDFVYILGAGSFNESYRRLLFLQQYNSYRKKQTVEISAKSHQYLLLKDKIENRKASVINHLDIVQTEQLLLSKEQEQRQTNVKKLQSKESHLRKEVKEAQRKANILENKILALIREASKGNEDDSPYSAAFKDNKGKLMWPLQNGVVIGHFGEHEHAVIKNLRVSNNGIDIQKTSTNQVKVIFGGKVSRLIAIPGFNATVIVRHGNILTVYSNIVNVQVQQDSDVVMGQVIGDVYEGEGKYSGVLHFELWDQGTKQNPANWLK